MIDKKIEETARLDDEEYYDRLSDNDRCFFEYGFRRGYNQLQRDCFTLLAKFLEMIMVRFSHSQKLIVI